MAYICGFVFFLVQVCGLIRADQAKGVLSPNPLIAFAGHRLSLTCRLKSDNYSVSEISFEFSASKLAAAIPFTRILNSSTVYLRISNIPEGLKTSNVTCKAGNEILDVIEIQIRTPQFPPPPDCVSDSHMLYCTWNNHSRHGDETILLIRTRLRVNRWERDESFYFPGILGVDGNVTSSIDTYLAGDNFKLYYVIKHKCGSNAFSRLYHKEMLRLIKPVRIVDFQTDGLRNDSILLGWIKPISQYKLNLIYKIIYTNKGVIHEITARTYYTKVYGLEPNTNYTFVLSCRPTVGNDEVGFWSDSVSIVATTLPDGAIEKPEFSKLLVRYVERITTLILIFAPRHIYPALYRIQYSSGNTTKEVFSSSNDVVVENLSAETNYTFHGDMHFVSANEEILWSDVVSKTVMTLPDIDRI